MIHIAIGTKAQFIKMAPLMQELARRKIEFNLIDLGQHALITSGLREEFGLKEPDVYLSRGANVSRLFQGLVWILRLLFKGLNSAWVKSKVFLDKPGVCLIHGDTVSTILALYLAKRAGLSVAHIEAGLRSYNYLEPFPEEIMRVLAMRFSDILFTPSGWAFDNLKKMGAQARAVAIEGNTSLEATRYSLKKQLALSLPAGFALITVHRLENIFSRRRLRFVVDLVERIAADRPVVFVQHPPTINQLRKFKLDARLNKMKNVHFFKIVSHAHFVSLLNSCEFVITDGGSIQEESFYLDKPCCLLRTYTERQEGLGENVYLSKLSGENIDYFLANYARMKRNSPLAKGLKPSGQIIDWLEASAAAGKPAVDQTYYDKNIYSQEHQRLSNFESGFQRYRLAKVLDIYKPGQAEKVLDMGCGWGTFCFALAPLCREVTGLDFSAKSIELCQELLRQQPASNLSFICAEAQNSGLEPASYDVIICADLFEHLYPDAFKDVLDACHRLLRPGGKLVIWTPHRGHILEVLKNHNIILRRDPTHVDYKSREGIQAELVQRHFLIRKSYYTESHIPVFRNLERLFLGWLPLLRRRIAILAEKTD